MLLTLFPGIGILDAAFGAAGFCVVRGPDLLWGGNVKRFSPPTGGFDGIVGGIPCQAHSSLAHICRAQGFKIAEDMTPEFERVVGEARPRWWLSENVKTAPIPAVAGYAVADHKLNARHFAGSQHREHRFCFGWREDFGPAPALTFRWAALESSDWSYRVTSSTSGRPVALLAGGVRKGGGKRQRSGLDYVNGTGKKQSGGELGRFRLSIPECCELQGLPADFFEKSPFLQDSLRQMIANAVPYHLALAIADAVARALGMPGCATPEFQDERCYEQPIPDGSP